ncbi:MAG: glycoside hydrolase family 66 protein, partial [Salinivirgaceae bacterium]|nr:glycoside hydrolase family 66 protein [Salinivirgaceae bacterium]
GALSDASYDGVSEEWYIFSDNNHTNKDKHSLPKPPFKSDIFLIDPANPNWQNYLNGRNTDVYDALNFDGFHIDQLGDRGTRYDYWGNQVNLPSGYGSFITASKKAAPEKYHVMNAVNQFGQGNIASSASDFLYTEVWSPNDSYASLTQIILDNNAFGNNQKNSILAAYMNYNLANSTGYFNTPAVLFTDAVIFAFGGSHLELGEHMLCKEYFPNNNLAMRADLQKALVAYYDFLVAYQNLLRGGGTFNSPAITATDGKTSLNQWPPASGKVSVIGKEFTDKQVVHLINLSTANHFDWRDNEGNQSYPTTYYNCAYSFAPTKPVSKVWFASPDYNYGASVEIVFQTNGNNITFILPALSYWDMVVIEY